MGNRRSGTWYDPRVVETHGKEVIGKDVEGFMRYMMVANQALFAFVADDSGQELAIHVATEEQIRSLAAGTRFFVAPRSILDHPNVIG